MAHATLMSPLSILAVFGDIQAGTTLQRAGLALVEKLREHGFEVVPACSAADGAAAIGSDPLIGALIVDADLDQSGGAEAVLRYRDNLLPPMFASMLAYGSSIRIDGLRRG